MILPEIGILISGMATSATCDSTQDAPALLQSYVSIPLGYLAKAIPDGPFSIQPTAPSPFYIAVRPGRMNVDPGNFVQVKRPLKIGIVSSSSGPGELQLEITERAEASANVDATHYSLSWSKTLRSPLPEDDQSLDKWLVCAHPGFDRGARTVLGELRESRAKR